MSALPFDETPETEANQQKPTMQKLDKWESVVKQHVIDKAKIESTDEAESRIRVLETNAKGKEEDDFPKEFNKSDLHWLQHLFSSHLAYSVHAFNKFDEWYLQPDFIRTFCAKRLSNTDKENIKTDALLQ
ncbi:MAG: hypothetical protein Q9218_006974 [Villophora microphyllina]